MKREFNITSPQMDLFLKKLNDLRSALRPYADLVDTDTLDSLQEELEERIKTLRQTGGNIRIALIGQVKAGKSSFLNTLLFDGETVLPQALFPTTSVLTQLVYAENNELEIQYYTPDEWRLLEKSASSLLETDCARAARDLVTACAKRGLPGPPQERTERFRFATRRELASYLVRYVGEDGERSPIVKSVLVKMNHQGLRGVDITDTPGLNDPVYSRTNQARKSLQQCDAAFFLSRAGRFLDADDMQLLLRLLPQRGLARLVLVASLYDTAVMDTIYDHSSLLLAESATRDLLCRHAKKTLDQARRSLSGDSPALDYLLEQCETPVFASAEVYSILHNQNRPHTDRQRLILSTLGCHSDLNQDQLHTIAGFDVIKKMFDEISSSGSTLLTQRYEAMVPAAQEHLYRLTHQLRTEALSLSGRLTTENSALIKQQTMLEEQVRQSRDLIRGIYRVVASHFDDKLKKAKAALLARGEQLAMSVKIGVDIIYESKTVSDSKFFYPWTWRRSYREVLAKETQYDYVNPSDFTPLMDCLLTDARFAAKELLALYPGSLRGDLIVMAADFTASDPSLTKDRIEKMINAAVAAVPLHIEFAMPEMPVSITSYSSQIRDTAEQESLQQAARQSILEASGQICGQLSLLAEEFRRKLHYSESVFCEQLFRNNARAVSQLRGRTEKITRDLARLDEARSRLP